MAVKTITKDNFEQEVLACKKPVLLLFMTDTCEESKKQLASMEQLDKELDGTAVFGKVDVNESITIAFQYQIMSTPTTVAMSYGIFRGRANGCLDVEALKKMIADCGDGTFSINR